MKNPFSVVLPIIALLAAMLSIQAGASLAKMLFPVFGVQGTNAIRLNLGAVILFLLLRAWKARIHRGNWQSLAVYGVTLAGLYAMFYQAVGRLPLGIASALEFLGPFAVAVMLSRRLIDFFWVSLVAAGLLLLSPFAGPVRDLDPIGVAWALGAATCWAFYIVFGKRAGAEHGNMAAALGMVIAAAITLPIGVNQAGASLLQISFWPAALGMTLLSSAMPLFLEMFALRRLPARSFSILLSLEPAIGALLGLVILHEWLHTTQWLAIALIVTASIGTTISAPSARQN